MRRRPTDLTGGETILVAEDEHDVRNLICELLETAGYQAVPAVDGLEAEQLCRTGERPFDLVVLDAIMPRRNGREVYRTLKSSHPAVPVIFISGHPPDTIGQDFLEAENIQLISKPFNPELLLSEVRNTLKATS